MEGDDPVMTSVFRATSQRRNHSHRTQTSLITRPLRPASRVKESFAQQTAGNLSKNPFIRHRGPGRRASLQPEGSDDEQGGLREVSTTFEGFARTKTLLSTVGGLRYVTRRPSIPQQLAPVYFKHVFCPLIRCETTNSILKDYVLREDTIETFIGQYTLFHNIEGDKFEPALKSPTYCTRQPIERHAAEIYTMGVFLKFQKELLDASAFDRDGILCCHVLRLFTQFGINTIPEHYIKQRWTKKLQKLFEKTGSNVSQNALRYAMLMDTGAEICATVSKDANHCKIFVEELERIQHKLASRE
ncbi:hypothetical protein EJB05_47389, partial [Eragrostis curvula]